MYSFIIQKTSKHLSSDSAILVESIEYQRFMGNDDYEYFIVNDLEDVDRLTNINGEKIPIGTVEFVENFINKYNLPNKNFRPIFLNNKFTKHQNVTDSLADIEMIFTYHKELFIKPFDKFKSNFTDTYGYIFTKKEITLFDNNKKYLVSKVENILSEYRIFVFFGKIRGIYNYGGEFTEFLSPLHLNTIEEMIGSVTIENLNAYTLDIAILDNKSIQLLELHPFSSCGLYGFSDYTVIPQMYINAFKYLTYLSY